MALKNAKKNKEGQKDESESPEEGSDGGATSDNANSNRIEVSPAISAVVVDPNQKPEPKTSITKTPPKK